MASDAEGCSQLASARAHRCCSFWASTLTRMLAIPKNPCPVQGLVPWAGGVWPIQWRGPHPVLLWLYTIHEKLPERGLQIHWNVSQEQIVRAMLERAAFKPGDSVQLGPMARRRILQRKWSFERGSFYYLIEGARAGREWSMGEEELLKRIKGGEEVVGG